MTKEEKFRFDLQGFLVVKNVLSADEVDALNKLADEVWPAGRAKMAMETAARVAFQCGVQKRRRCSITPMRCRI